MELVKQRVEGTFAELLQISGNRNLSMRLPILSHGMTQIFPKNIPHAFREFSQTLSWNKLCFAGYDWTIIDGIILGTILKVVLKNAMIDFHFGILGRSSSFILSLLCHISI